MNLNHKTTPVCRAVLVVIVSVAIASSIKVASAQPGAGPPAAVTAAEVLVVSPKIERSFVGTVLPFRTAVLGSAVAGRVLEFPLRPGDVVEAEGIVTQLKTDTIDFEIALADAERRQRESEVTQIERPEDVNIAKARLASAKARYKYQEARRGRFEELYQNGGSVTEEQYEEVFADALEAQENLNVAQAQFDGMTQGSKLDQLTQAKAKLDFAKASLDLLVTKKAKHSIRSPFRGYVVKTYTEMGAWLSQGDPAVEVIDIEQVEVEFSVPEQYIAQVREGAIANITFNAMPQQVFKVPITTVIPMGDIRSRTFPVRVRMENQPVDKPAELGGTQKRLFRAGMYCTVKVDSSAEMKKTFVPKDALVLNNDTSVIYVIRKQGSSNEGIVDLLPVVIGNGQGQYVEVSGPAVAALKAGDLVVVGGNERLRPKQNVRHRSKLEEYQK